MSRVRIKPLMSLAPEDTEERLDRFGLSLMWMGAREDQDLQDSPTYFVLAVSE